MATYGTIPTVGPPPISSISGAKERIKSDLSRRRPWKEMLPLSFPSGFTEAIFRLKINLSYFHMNYVILILLVLFLSLLWYPTSLILFVVMMAAWLFLYFLRDDPLVVFGLEVEDCTISVVLSVFTIITLLLTQATKNIVVGMLVGGAMVLVHSVLRRTEDLFFDEEGGGIGGGGDGARRVMN